MSVIALVPARAGSRGIPGKNFRVLDGEALVHRATRCGQDAGCDHVFVSTDLDAVSHGARVWIAAVDIIRRPANLAQDDTPMLAVVQHALQQIPGQPDDIIVLLEPTQPFRTPTHVKSAIALLQESGADSVVSVVALPLTHSPDMVCSVYQGRLLTWWSAMGGDHTWPARRQDARPAYIRDGTVYAFKRSTVEQHGNIYGEDCRPLIIDPADSCELDTEADWDAVVKRWEARHGRTVQG